jgi:hypothetical protein
MVLDSPGCLIWIEYQSMRFQDKNRVPRLSHDADFEGFRSSRFLQLPYPITAIFMSINFIFH